MSKLISYAGYACTVAFACITGTSIVIDRDDPLERSGEFSYNREKLSIPFGDSTILDAELFYPDDPYALVVFMPGFTATYAYYKDYLKHLASHGYLLLGLDYSDCLLYRDTEHDVKAEQALTAIGFVRGLKTAYEKLPVFTAGHSYGGKIAFYAAALSTEIVGVLALDPVNQGGPPCLVSPSICNNYPVAPNRKSGQRGVLHQIHNASSIIMRSAPDPFAAPDAQFNARNFYFGLDDDSFLDAAPSPSNYLDFGNLPHLAYVTFLPSEQIQIIKRTMVAYLNQEVIGFDANEYLEGSRIQRDIENNRLDSEQGRR